MKDRQLANHDFNQQTKAPTIDSIRCYYMKGSNTLAKEAYTMKLFKLNVHLPSNISTKTKPFYVACYATSNIELQVERRVQSASNAALIHTEFHLAPWLSLPNYHLKAGLGMHDQAQISSFGLQSFYLFSLTCTRIAFGLACLH